MNTEATANTILALQRPNGAIPYDEQGGLDPWNHVEAAMGLDVAARHDAAARAYLWLRHLQNNDGSWYSQYRHGEPVNADLDANFTAYIAVGVLHHYLTTGDMTFLADLWPAVDRAITFVLTLQRESGEFAWRWSPEHGLRDTTLLAGNCSIHHALRSASTLADITGNRRPQWTESADQLQNAITTQPDSFTPKPHAMDWYYPVLGGVLEDAAATTHLAVGWNRFVVPGHGVRCVRHEPWVTGGETAELALTLAVRGDTHRASQVFATLQRLRTADGDYWTGHNYSTDNLWPLERTTWTSGAALLAHAAITGHHSTCRTFGVRSVNSVS
ncbi:prenyltransferase [Amycolatopsis antarctica]|uniref:Prenyltransferase n=1 Tax=Amycolatopsis antarctica TaxID=1854586 RepID=A0A263D3B8_9PSEU|nr:hypothetical protein [Amycolatopsis antarctica]OZM72117.1 prenyltransferase [Amycolatopsis antarctica]